MKPMTRGDDHDEDSSPWCLFKWYSSLLNRLDIVRTSGATEFLVALVFVDHVPHSYSWAIGSLLLATGKFEVSANTLIRSVRDSVSAAWRQRPQLLKAKNVFLISEWTCSAVPENNHCPHPVLALIIC